MQSSRHDPSAQEQASGQFGRDEGDVQAVVAPAEGRAALAGTFTKKAGGLRFDTREDALNFARESVEDSRGWLAARGLTVADRYKKGQFGLRAKLEIAAGSDVRQFKFLLVAIPSEKSEGRWFAELTRKAIEVGHIHVNLEHNLMLVWSGEPTQSVQEIVPSAVWLECFEESDHFDGDVFTPFLNGIVNLADIFGKRKVVVPFAGSEFNGSRIDGLIKGVPEVVDDAGGEIAGTARYCIDDSKFYDFLAC